MFGNKKNKLEERIKDAFSEVSVRRNVFETEITQVEECESHIHEELCQIVENSVGLVNNAMLNIEEESALIHSIDNFSKDLREAVDGYTQLTEAVSNQMTDITELVEENKHYTSPAKYLKESSVSLEHSFKSYETKLDGMTEMSKQMGIMALDAAEEARSMGKSAKQFVAISEDIHEMAANYEKETVSLKEDMMRSHEKVEVLEETINRLVALIKDGNIATTRLLKKCKEIEKIVQNSNMRDFSEDLILMRDKVVGMRNLDEEVAKCGERMNIQLNDIQEEVLNQKSDLIELESELSYLFDTVEKRLK